MGSLFAQGGASQRIELDLGQELQSRLQLTCSTVQMSQFEACSIAKRDSRRLIGSDQPLSAGCLCIAGSTQQLTSPKASFRADLACEGVLSPHAAEGLHRLLAQRRLLFCRNCSTFSTQSHGACQRLLCRLL
jgi:hypothetical protein